MTSQQNNNVQLSKHRQGSLLVIISFHPNSPLVDEKKRSQAANMTASMKFLTWRNMFRSRIRKTEPCTSASRYFRPRSHNKVWTIFHPRTSPKEFLPNVVQSHWSTNDKLNTEKRQKLCEIDISKVEGISEINWTARCRATRSFKTSVYGRARWLVFRDKDNFSHPLLQLFEWKTFFNNLFGK